MAGDVWQELCDEVVGRGEGEAGGIALGAGWKVSGAARYVEVVYLVLDGEADEIGVVDHPLAVVALGPDDLQNGVFDAVGDGSARFTVVVGVLVGD